MNQRGDTIIEVLIAIVIVASVLAGAFAASHRAQIASQQNDERSRATSILEDQIERLSIAAADSTNAVNTQPVGYVACFQGGAAPIVPTTNLALCRVDNLYDVQFEKTDDNTFHIQVEWERVGGDGPSTIDSIEAYYRAYPR